MIKKSVKIWVLLMIILGLVGVSGCSSTTEADSTKQQTRKIVVGTGQDYKNICFVNEKGELTGYEVEVLKEIDKRLPQYEFEFKVSDLNAILVNLETGKIDLAAHQFEINPERQKKFLFASEGVSTYDLFLVTKDDRNDIKSFEDIAKIGGTLEVGKASANKTYLADKWNKEHGSKINIVLAAADTTVTLQNIKSGKTDAFIHIQRVVDEYNKEFNAKIKTVGEPISVSSSYYIYRKNDPVSTELQKDIDIVIKQLKEDGTLEKLSQKWFGGSYIPKK